MTEITEQNVNKFPWRIDKSLQKNINVLRLEVKLVFSAVDRWNPMEKIMEQYQQNGDSLDNCDLLLCEWRYSCFNTHFLSITTAKIRKKYLLYQKKEYFCKKYHENHCI